MPSHAPDIPVERRTLAAHFRVRLVGWLCVLAPRLVALSSAGLVALSSAGLVALSSGCRQSESTAAEAAPPPPRVDRGTHVVVERTAGNFVEATVLEEQGEHLRLQSADGSQSMRVSKTSVYSLTLPVTETTPGQFAICSIQRLVWAGCKVLGEQANEIAVVTAAAERHRLTRRQVLRATELTRMNVKQAFAKAERRAHFLQELSAAGLPAAPTGWRPSPRERVIAKRQNDWYAARVHELEDDGVRVSWQDSQNTEKVGKDELIPEPPYPELLERGQFALMRPRVESEPWVYVKVRAAGDVYKVEDIKGEVSHAAQTALVPLMHR